MSLIVRAVLTLGRVEEQGDHLGLRNQLGQQFEPLRRQLAGLGGDSGEVAARPAKLATRPSTTGSPPVKKTIGIVVVAVFATSAVGVPAERRDYSDLAGDKIGGHCRQSIANVPPPSGIRSLHLPSTKPASLKPWRNAATNGAEGPGEAKWRKPITGIAFCCARRATGQASAAPPSQGYGIAPLHRARLTPPT